jgi:integrase
LDVRGRVASASVRTVFVSLGGTRPGSPLSPRGLGKICKSLGSRAGLAELSPHDLRRSFAHLALRYGAPTRTVQIAGRWEQLRQVETYSRDLALDDFDPYSPVARLLATNRM